MQAHPLHFLGLALASALIANPVEGQYGLDFLPGSEYLLRLNSGEIKAGFAVFPARYLGDEPIEILDPSPFHLHMTDADEPGVELIYPAGESFDPPVGRYRMWLQGEGGMTPFTDLVSFGAKRPRGAKVVKTMPVVPAGRVTIAADRLVRPDQQLRLLYIGGETAADVLRHELSRRRRVSDLGAGLLMPEGRVLAALYDPREERYVGLSRDFVVRAGAATAVPLKSPGPDAADLVVYVDRPADALASNLRGILLRVVQQGEEHPAQVAVTTPWGIYAVWYGLSSGPAVLDGGNGELYLDPAPLKLTGGRITRFQGKLSERLLLN